MGTLFTFGIILYTLLLCEEYDLQVQGREIKNYHGDNMIKIYEYQVHPIILYYAIRQDSYIMMLPYMVPVFYDTHIQS